MSDILVGRQPIYNRDLDIHAYELIPRSSRSNKDPHQADDDKTTSQLVINAFLEIGIDKIVNSHTAFIKLAERFLRSDEALPLPTENVILKIPGYIKVDDEVIAGAKRLTTAGFKLAIDNYLIQKELYPLAEMAHMINLNTEALDPASLKNHVKVLKKTQTVLLADNINTYDEYEAYRSLGIDYFQGYFLSRPRIISGKSLATNQLSIMSLMATLHNPETDADTIDAAISKDVSLSYRILKLMNSAFFSTASKIESIHHAIVLLGRRQLCTWASMMALTGMDEKPRSQVEIAMIRAKTCELLASKAGLESPDSFFTVGMFSALDLLMDQSLEDLITPLPLADIITAALLNRESTLGEALNCALAQETADWVNIRFADLSVNDLSAINIEAIGWTREVLNAA